MKIIADQNIPYLSQYFSSYGELILKDGRHLSATDVADADILIVRAVTKVDKTLLAGSSVKFVGSITAGADHLDLQWLESANIPYYVAKGFNAPPVADYVMSCIAALAAVLPANKPLRAAVIGVGNTGKLVVERLRQLNFDLLMTDPLRAEAEADFVSTSLTDIEDCDVITIHVPLTKIGPHPTWQFISSEFLKKQKPGCLLINTSRGDVIDIEQLKQNGQQLKWCFDVWQNEPNIDKSLLSKAIIATPHIAGYSVQGKRRGVEMLYQAACQHGIIESQFIDLPKLSAQTLSLAGDKYHWQDIVLGIFNPILMTATLRAKILASDNPGKVFDETRNGFQYRNEFGFTSVAKKHVYSEEVSILKMLGITII